MAHGGKELGFGAAPGLGGLLGGHKVILITAQFLERLGRTQHVTHALAQDRPLQRLGDEVGGADPIGFGDRGLIVEAGGHQNRSVGRFRQAAQRLAKLVAVHPRHHHVDHQQIRHAGATGFQGLQAIDGLHDQETFIFQLGTHDGAQDVVVVHDQDSGGRRLDGLRRHGHRSPRSVWPARRGRL